MKGKDLQEKLDTLVDAMSDKELASFIPRESLKLIVKGFLAGILGPKKYEKNNWTSLDLQSTNDILPALYRHLESTEEGILDPDTDLENPEIFVGARAIMYLYFKEKERIKGIKPERQVRFAKQAAVRKWPKLPLD